MARVISGGAWRNYNAAKELEIIWETREYSGASIGENIWSLLASRYIRKHFSV